MPRPINAWLIPLALAARVQPWVPTWVNERANEGSSWLVSLVLHLAILVWLFLSPFAVPRCDHAESANAILTRLDAGGDAGLLDEMLSLGGNGAADEGKGQGSLHDIGGAPPRAEWAELEFLGAGSGDEERPEHSDGSALPALSTNTLSLSAAVDFDRNQVGRDGADRNVVAKSAARIGATGRGKGPRTTQRQAENVKEQLANLEEILAGREPEARARLAKSAGGTKESER